MKGREQTEIDNTQIQTAFLKTLIEFIEKNKYLNNENASDGVCSLNGKQVQLFTLEDLLPKAELEAAYEKMDKTTAEFKHESPKVKISGRLGKEAKMFITEFGVEPKGLNYRQKIILNSILFSAATDTSMALMSSSEAYRNSMKEKHADKPINRAMAIALAGIDFSKMGMNEIGDKKFSQEVLRELKDALAYTNILADQLENEKEQLAELKGTKWKNREEYKIQKNHVKALEGIMNDHTIPIKDKRDLFKISGEAKKVQLESESQKQAGKTFRKKLGGSLRKPKKSNSNLTLRGVFSRKTQSEPDQGKKSKQDDYQPPKPGSGGSNKGGNN